MRILVSIAVAAAGLAAAFALTVAPVARAYDIGALPAPYVVSLQVDASNGDCPNFYVVAWYDQSVRLNFGTNSHGGDCNSHFQEQLDAFVDATIGLTPPATTTVPPVTTDATTTAVPPVTTTDQTVTATTTTASVPTQTVTVTVTDPTVDARLTALEAQYAALAARVDAIAKANTASWDAFSASLAAGGTVADAALAARSAGLNAVYQLG